MRLPALYTPTGKFGGAMDVKYGHCKSDSIEGRTLCVVYISNGVFWLNQYLWFIQQLP